jgi:hypothetical protein
MENGIDLLTQEEFTKQRSNQKFASSKNRIRYNNLKARKKRITKGPIDRTLDQNRTILSRILGDKTEIVVSKYFLLGAGFCFAYYSFNNVVDGINYSGIYEFEIGKISDDKYKIIKFQ